MNTLTNDDIRAKEERIVQLRNDYFTMKGVMNQVDLYLLYQEEQSDLICQPMPSSARDD